MSAESQPKRLSPMGRDFTPTTHYDTYDFVNPKQFDLAGKAVLVTGASKGIGRATALSFAAAGTSLIAIGARSPLDDLVAEIHHTAKQAGRSEPQVLTFNLDVESYDSVTAAAETVQKEFGRLDILINNAGYAEPFIPITKVDPEQWKKTYSVNLTGVFHVTRAFLPLLNETHDGLKEILMLSSIGALAHAPGGSAYRPGKLALIRFAEIVNAENPEILSYSIHPGGVATELAQALPKKMVEAFKDTPQLAGDSIVWLMSSRREWLKDRYVSLTWDMQELLGKQKRIEDEDLLKLKMDFGFE